MKRKSIDIAVFVAAGIIALAGVLYISFKPKTLTIIHVNDTHSQIEPIRSGEYAGMGGMLERAAYVDSVRRADGPENVLLLHAGDFCQGSVYFNEFKGKLEVAELDALGYDAATLGNHEFDNGIEALGELLRSCHVPVVVCNYDFSPFEAGRYIKPYVVVEKAGLKIGIVGVLCGLKDMVAGDIADRIPAYDTVPTVQGYVNILREKEGCDMVIALTHIGYTEHNPGDLIDSQLCAATRGIDVFVGGHSHTFMEQPDEVPNLDGVPVPIVQTGWMGAYMGEFHYKP
ncbi:MAG: metallophosphoesterase [Bacteroidales bacterium]|nr:metallophosphoesterase [Bacteroidales bacterium]